MNANRNLTKAKSAKNDEFFTQLSDIEKELKYYKNHFKGKIVFCNCDDPEYSNFWKYFELNFEHLELKKLIATHFHTDRKTYKLEIIGDINSDGKINKADIIKTELNENGDFRSPECIELLKEADIIVTNPPFSLFREYIAQLMEYKKKFLVIGNMNAITYKEVFKYIKDNKLWLGAGKNDGRNIWYEVPKTYPIFHKEENNKFYAFVAGTVWFTNLTHSKRNEELILYKRYNPSDYPEYDNYDAINIDKVKDIPVDYDGVMGVPISFLNKHNPEQFEIIRFRKGNDEKDLSVNGKCPYFRILIKHREL